MKMTDLLTILRTNAAVFILCLAPATVSAHAAILPQDTVLERIQTAGIPETAAPSMPDSSRMTEQIHTMEKNLEENPDPKLEKRLHKAIKLRDCALQCIKCIRETAQNGLSGKKIPATAGISRELAEMNSPQYWYRQYQTYENRCLALDTESRYFHGYRGVSGIRKAIVNTALSMEGNIRYVWGGKPAGKGTDSRWKNGPAGLDCSGFVAWAYWTGTDSDTPDSSLYSTLSISACTGTEEITHDELLPGDLGMIADSGTYYTDLQGNRFFSPWEAVDSNRKYRDEREKELAEKAVEKEREKYRKRQNLKKQKKKTEKSGIFHSMQAAFDEEEYRKHLKVDTGIDINDISTHYNHVGIYVGKDGSGNDVWCHCTGGSQRTVVINSYGGFRHFYRVNALGKEK